MSNNQNRNVILAFLWGTIKLVSSLIFAIPAFLTYAILSFIASIVASGGNQKAADRIYDWGNQNFFAQLVRF